MSKNRIYNSSAGSRDHPPSIHSFDKPDEYHHELRQDMDQMQSMANLEDIGSPAWVNDVTAEPSHSGESTLFTQKLLAASRVSLF